ncbi:hypothetical protein [Methylovulum miyakonense]|uniref:hypothetical protein n=1 Tax=Methylovulum miyakonense TaxID=645578 RepID=UPI00036DF384|nr:hypothetical protein [Methylovulum miyakonense]
MLGQWFFLNGVVGSCPGCQQAEDKGLGWIYQDASLASDYSAAMGNASSKRQLGLAIPPFEGGTPVTPAVLSAEDTAWFWVFCWFVAAEGIFVGVQVLPAIA